jgi:hypothetical protein
MRPAIETVNSIRLANKESRARGFGGSGRNKVIPARRRLPPEHDEARADYAANALHRAEYGESTLNTDTIIAGFTAKGIQIDDIVPRVNVLTFHAWRALGRRIKKGEHGVKICVCRWNQQSVAINVFHASQTESLADADARKRG